MRDTVAQTDRVGQPGRGAATALAPIPLCHACYAAPLVVFAPRASDIALRETDGEVLGSTLMAKPKLLKVYRTPIGFHDAYVAAPSQKAALEAWGAKHDLFSRGVAEIVTDEVLTKEPLAHPGTVIRRSRGTMAEQIAALPPHAPTQRQDASSGAEPAAAATAKTRAPRPRPRPSRDKVEREEKALAHLQEVHAAARRSLAEEQAALDRRRAELERLQQAEVTKAQKALQEAEEHYAAALGRWHG